MTQNIRVVIAEDDIQIAEIQKRFLERIDGVELVGIAHTLEDAEDLVDVFKPELLLLDNHFPKGTGLELLRRLRATNCETDVILITAAKEVDTLREALRSGVFYYILKPLVFERLQEAIHQYAAHLQKLREMEDLVQTDVDTLLPQRSNASATVTETAPAIQRLPKGIDGITLDKIRTVFADSDQSLNAEEVGALIGASRTTARRYLEYMVSTQELQAQVNYGSVGRPERRYVSSDT
ncbi:response regulator [Grimontia hollisae]|uniref:Transcriptional regulatory protein n=1 Tax=Grimontia hollisae CIP 101886 TaxID=675812 RepID=D0IAT9_GRIHO|nr:response regulator [Grimontia hollisae]AMG31962.1 response regulator [Grimontia hollisae]EEY71007.1 transcriptional regulatory protein CitB [Grimontia hollisae CIP 101886]STO44362.1 Transcriptional regulatory protein CitT [Grimontia hollisae]